MYPRYTKFRGISHVGSGAITSKISAGLESYLNWAFLDIGGFTNVTRPSSGVYGGYAHYLQHQSDPNFDTGRVWQGYKQNWVWESGLDYSTQPVQISGVWVNGSFKYQTDSQYSHYVDYPGGRIIFDSGISPTDTVELEYSYRYVGVYPYDSPYIQDLQYETWNYNGSNYIEGSGQYGQLPSTRIQLPAIGIEVVNRRDFYPLQLGGGHGMFNRVVFHIFTEYNSDCETLVDILGNQVTKPIYLYDTDRVAIHNVYPLDYRGMIVSGAMMYPNLIANYTWKLAIWQDTTVQEKRRVNPHLFNGKVATNLEMFMPEI